MRMWCARGAPVIHARATTLAFHAARASVARHRNAGSVARHCNVLTQIAATRVFAAAEPTNIASIVITAVGRDARSVHPGIAIPYATFAANHADLPILVAVVITAGGGNARRVHAGVAVPNTAFSADHAVVAVLPAIR